MKMAKFILVSIGMVGAFIVIALSIFIFLTLINNRIPFVEGDKIFIDGTACGFVIGSEKSEVLMNIQQYYNKENYYLRAPWTELFEDNLDDLSDSEITELKNYTNAKYSEYKFEISEIKEMTGQLAYASGWNIEMPGWVNKVYLKFDEGKLVEIRKSRWVFERP